MTKENKEFVLAIIYTAILLSILYAIGYYTNSWRIILIVKAIIVIFCGILFIGIAVLFIWTVAYLIAKPAVEINKGIKNIKNNIRKNIKEKEEKKDKQIETLTKQLEEIKQLLKNKQ